MEKKFYHVMEKKFYHVKVNIKIASYRAISLTMIVSANAADASSCIKKKLKAKLEEIYARNNMPSKIEIKEMKKLKQDLFVWLD